MLEAVILEGIMSSLYVPNDTECRAAEALHVAISLYHEGR